VWQTEIPTQKQELKEYLRKGYNKGFITSIENSKMTITKADDIILFI